MTQTTHETAPAGGLAILVTFQWGDANAARYVRWTDDLTVGSDAFTAEPRIQTELGMQHGGTEDVEARLTLPRGLAPVSAICAGTAYAPTRVTIEECDPGDAAATRRTLYRGYAAGYRLNPAGRSALATLTIRSAKSRLGVPIGIPATTTCAWLFGDRRCGVDLEPLRRDALVESLNVDGNPRRVRLVFDTADSTADGLFLADPAGKLVTSPGGCVLVVDPTGDSGTEIGGTPPPLHWERGRVEIDGLRLTIRRDLGDGRFDLSRIPPAGWACAQAVVTAGCDKLLSTCREVYDNESQFGGIGYGIPDRNPVFER